MRIKRAATDVELCERLLDGAGVALVPGTAFGAPGHLRLSFAASLENSRRGARAAREIHGDVSRPASC